MRGEAAFTVRLHDANDDARWNEFVAGSPNGCLFQDLTFLGYHPAGRFDFRHLEVLRDNTLVAVMPGGLDAERIYRSPLGASTGGPALLSGLGATDVLAIAEALKDYALEQGWNGMEITLPPPTALEQPHQTIEFALHRAGFKLVRRWMCFLIALNSQGPHGFNDIFSPRQRTTVRAGQRRGVVVSEHGAEALPAFVELFEDTYRRHGRTPTHSPEEIGDLMRRFPSRVRLWMANAEGLALAGVLLFHLNARTAYTFYICDLEAHRNMNATTTLMAGIVEALAERGLAYLDLGPSASDSHFNDGVVRFKEGLGARPFCRDAYRWTP
jgi:hypothetical protein